MNTFSKTFQLLPKEYKKKSVIFCFFLAIATLLETLGIGLIFPLIDLIVNDKFTKNLFGNLIGFHLKDGYEACKKFINNLQLFYHVANIGDVRSLAIHPSSTTHSQLSIEDQEKAGVFKDYIRLSVGIEHEDDIILDIKNALEKI